MNNTTKTNFTFAQNDISEKMLTQTLSELSNDIAVDKDLAEELESVILGGGYGRGEGGSCPDGKLYNDLDFFVFPKNYKQGPFLRSKFENISRKYSKILEIEVDFYIVPSAKWFKVNGATLMLQELRNGYKVVFGNEKFLDKIPNNPWALLPWEEGARLLLNRGTGLLLSRSKLSDPAEIEFVRRNFNKAVLGCGDALLIAKHCYCHSGKERAKAILELFPASALGSAYSKSLNDKYFPNPLESLLPTKEEWNSIYEIWRESVIEFSHVVVGVTAADLRTALENLFSAPRSNHESKLRNMLLSIRYRQLGLFLHPLTTHPRIKLLKLLSECLSNENQAAEQKYLMLWERLN